MGQSEHAVEFAADAHEPEGQTSQTGGPVALAGYALPGAHAYGVHTGAVLPAGGPAEPTGHACATHTEALSAFATDDHVPAGQGVQSMAEMAPGA